MKIYTKTGDEGKTSLFGGSRISKDHWQIEAYGTVDELNSHIGLSMAFIKADEVNKELALIQHMLFNIGSILATPKDNDFNLPSVEEQDILSLENQIDQMNEHLQALNYFILPGGSKSIAQLHVARTVCRRAERRVISIIEEIKDAKPVIKYLNRLSDYLFVLARYMAHLEKVTEHKWEAKK